MKILIVSMVFMIVITGLLALQIKTSYTYQTAQLIITSTKQDMLLESALLHAIAMLKKTKRNYAYQLDFSNDIEGALISISIRADDTTAHIKAQLFTNRQLIKTATCIVDTKAAYTIKDWKV